jgi:hypothetical protein
VKVEKLAKIGGKGQNCYPLSPTTGANAGVTVTNKSSGVDFNFTIPPGADGADGDNIFDADGNLTVLGTNSSHNTTVYPFRVSTKSSSSTQVEEGIGTGIEFKVERQDTDNKQGHCGAIRVYGAAGIPGTRVSWRKGRSRPARCTRRRRPNTHERLKFRDSNPTLPESFRLT